MGAWRIARASPSCWRSTRRCAKKRRDTGGSMTRRQLREWSEVHDMEPVDWSPRRHLVAGSDDHGMLNLARAWTRVVRSFVET